MERCRALVERAEATLDVLRGQGVGELRCRSITGLVAHAGRQIDQVERRLLRGETIPHEEKVFSIFEEHTRWVSKGEAGTPVELRQVRARATSMAGPACRSNTAFFAIATT